MQLCKLGGGIRWTSNASGARYAEPMDNLIFAVLLQAAHDAKSKNPTLSNDAKKFLDNDGRLWWDYLKTKERY